MTVPALRSLSGFACSLEPDHYISHMDVCQPQLPHVITHCLDSASIAVDQPLGRYVFTSSWMKLMRLLYSYLYLQDIIHKLVNDELYQSHNEVFWSS